MAAWRLPHPETRTKNPFLHKRRKVATGRKERENPGFIPLGTDNVLSPVEEGLGWGSKQPAQQHKPPPFGEPSIYAV